MKTKKITIDQLTILGSSSLTLVNLYHKELSQARKNSIQELIEFYEKEINRILDILDELKLI